MAIRERVKPAKAPDPVDDLEAAELAVIGKGAAAKADMAQPTPEPSEPAETIAKFTLRIPRDILDAIGADAKAERLERRQNQNMRGEGSSVFINGE
jgi:hypothetical protein